MQPSDTNPIPPNSIYCDRCKKMVSWPADLDDAGKVEIARRKRESGLLPFTNIVDDFGLSWPDAKSIYIHISRGENVCVRCKHLVASGVTTCANCKSVNLNW